MQYVCATHNVGTGCTPSLPRTTTVIAHTHILFFVRKSQFGQQKGHSFLINIMTMARFITTTNNQKLFNSHYVLRNIVAIFLLLTTVVSATAQTITVDSSNTYSFYFKWKQWQIIDSVHSKELAKIGNEFTQHRNATFAITGWADTTGTETSNLHIALKRAESVRNYLRRKGVPANATGIDAGYTAGSTTAEVTMNAEKTISCQVFTKQSVFTITGTEISAYSGAGGTVIVPPIINGITITGVADATVNNGAFYAKNITSIIFSEGTTKIGNYAFYPNNSLRSVTLPSSLTRIGNAAFGYTALSSLIVKATTPPSLGDNTFINTPANLSIKVPTASVDAYKKATNWSSVASKISGI